MSDLMHLTQHFPLLGAALIFFGEGFGVPIPVEIPLGIIGYRVTSGLNTFWEMVGLMFWASLAGNLVGYAIGYWGGRPLALKFTRWVGVSDETWGRIETWFQKYGLLLVVGTRWINWGFAQNMMLSGITRIPFLRFFVVLVVNDLLWAIAWTWVAVIAIQKLQQFQLLHDYPVQLGLGALVILLVGLAGWWFYRRVKNRSK